MAGEWIPVDIALGTKPEVQELVDLSGQGVEVVVYRLLQLWGWASLNSADGTARATPERLARVCGGDADFWRHVEAVGWVTFDLEAGTATIPGWGRRFSMAAKARACHNDRQRRYTDAGLTLKRRSTVSPASAQERRGQIPPPPREAAQDTPDTGAAWSILRDAWNSGHGRPWKPSQPPDQALARLAEPGWLDEALEAIQRLQRCRYFETPVTLPQFVARPGFARDVAGGKYDDVRPPRPGAGDRPAPKIDPAFAAARDATLAREQARRDAEHRRLDEAAQTDVQQARSQTAARLRVRS